jgi:hypothetical protein
MRDVGDWRCWGSGFDAPYFSGTHRRRPGEAGYGRSWRPLRGRIREDCRRVAYQDAKARQDDSPRPESRYSQKRRRAAGLTPSRLTPAPASSASRPAPFLLPSCIASSSSTRRQSVTRLLTRTASDDHANPICPAASGRYLPMCAQEVSRIQDRTTRPPKVSPPQKSNCALSLKRRASRMFVGRCQAA